MYIVQDIFKIYEKIVAGQLIENDMQYHKEIAEALTNDYDLAFITFASCSPEFFQWFSKEFISEIIRIISHYKKKELLLVLKANLVEKVNGNQYDERIGSVHTIYHATYKICY
jgi:hypothetical protein